MTKKHFSEAEQRQLAKSPHVVRISAASITYADEFKRLFIDQNMRGVSPREIFEANGLDPNVLGLKRVEQCAARWKKAYGRDGITGLADARKEAFLRPSKRELSPEEIIARQQAHIQLLESQLDYVKKFDESERRLLTSQNLPKTKRFELIEEAVREGLGRRVRYLCQLLQVSRSGYYAYLNAAPARVNQLQKDENAIALIKKAFFKRGYKKGCRMVKMTLQSEYATVYNLKRIRRLMKKANLVCPIRKANPYRKIAKATQEHRTLPNKLNRDFKRGVPGLALLTDITYLPYGKSGMAYLSTVLDASTNEVLAHSFSSSITLSIATDTITNLMKQRRVKLHKEAFIHSDQGSHYTSPKYQKLLESKKLGQSMSRRGNCWDNAPQESFFGHMKDHVKSRLCHTLEELQTMVHDYIHYHNTHRYQWNLKKMTPVQYRNHLLQAS